MIEILYSTLILFGGFLPFFFIFSNFKYMKKFMLTILLIIALPMVFAFSRLSVCSNYTHTLCQQKKIEYTQSLGDYPIKSLYATYNENGTIIGINYDRMSDETFSIIKTEYYSTQCLENYYIKTNVSCPITDIKFENKKSSEYHNYIKINDEEYLYYTNENKLGKLYKSFNYKDFKENKEDIIPIDKIIRKEFHKLSNPVLNFKNYIYFCDSFNPSLILILLFLSLFENSDDLKCDILKIINTFILQLMISILYYIRFIKFIEVKNFLFENEDIYREERYRPNKVFNIDSFPFGLCINLFLFNLLHIIFPNKKSLCKKRNNGIDILEEKKEKTIIPYLLLFIRFIYFALLFPLFLIELSRLNSKGTELNLYNRYYDYIIYNWKMNPIKSIKLKENITYNKYSYYSFEDFFEIERLNDYNYINIFQINRGKICGKDNYGNYLFFPKEIDCPINHIFFSDIDKDLPDYKKIKFNKNNYLYYTNQFLEGKMIMDLWNHPYSSDWYNDNPDFSIPFTEYIYSSYLTLYSVYYIGINITSIPENADDIIKNFEYNIELYKSFPLVLLILYCCEFFFSFFSLIFLDCSFKKKLSFFILFLLINATFIIILILELNIHIKYIMNFLDKINSDFEYWRCDFRWDIIIFLIVSVISFIVLILILIKFVYPKNNDLKDEDIRLNLISNLDKDFITPNENKINEIKEIEESNQINIIKDDESENINKDEIIKIDEINNKNEEKSDIIIDEKKEVEDINKQLNENEKEINDLNFNLPFELNEGEKLMTVIFQSFEDKELHCPIICKEKLSFYKLEELLYDKYPKYKENENEFYVGENKINKLKTLEENNIKDGQIIMIKILN